MTTLIRRSRFAAAAALAGGVLAACGSSSSSPSASAGSRQLPTTATGTTAGGGASRSAFRACLKAHGVTLPSRPRGSGRPPSRAPGGYGGGGLFGGGGGNGRGAPGGFQANPKLAAALKACGGGQFPRRRFAQPSHAAIARFVACVRQHGYDMPSPNLSGSGPVFPSRVRTNAKFQAASRACVSTLFPGRRATAAASSSSS